jgi:HD-GYP domain-containing protein (c-di-GMP phosphodiesterase class II)
MRPRRETPPDESKRTTRARERIVELVVAGSLGAVALGLSSLPGNNVALAAAIVVVVASLFALKATRTRSIPEAFGVRPPELALVAVAAVGATLIGLGGVLAVLLVCFSAWSLVIRGETDDLDGHQPSGEMTLHMMLTSMARVSELHDQQTHGHCQRVAFDCVQVGSYLGLPDDDLYALQWAALLHDVGKSVIPTDILLKPGALTSEEFEVVKTHCRAGAELVLSTSPSLVAIAKGIAGHHERWDGNGYPIGLSGDAIPLASRIIAVVDVFEALTTNRPYRGALDRSTAFEIIRAGAGTHFDPDIVAVCELLYARGEAFRRGHITDRGVASLARFGGDFHQEAGSIASLTTL